MQKYKIMGIFAHPDDETFGPGGTLIKYAKQGHEISCLTLTSGQAGQSSNKIVLQDIGVHRQKELENAAKKIGIQKLTIAKFFDGSLNEQQLPLIKEQIKNFVNDIKPDVIIIYELGGISLHLDHIAASKAVIQLYDTGEISVKKLYYFGINSQLASFMKREQYLKGIKPCEIDISEFWPAKKAAMYEHSSQEFDYIRLITRSDEFAKVNSGKYSESFELARSTIMDLSFPESDLLAGLN